jgi:CDP-6-deoxy-D-xylo-4-hexulose-3-dehydrase
MTVKQDAPFLRSELVAHLELHRIQTRSLFAGNILHHPAYSSVSCRVTGELATTDDVLRGGFFIGVYPGITETMIEYMADTIARFIGSYD